MRSQEKELKVILVLVGLMMLLLWIMTINLIVNQEKDDAPSNPSTSRVTAGDIYFTGTIVRYVHQIGGYEDGGEYLLVTGVNEDEDTVTGLDVSGEKQTVEIKRVTFVYDPAKAPTDEYERVAGLFLKELARNSRSSKE